MRIGALLLAILSAAAAAFSASGEPLYLGVLEGNTVRVAFQFNGVRWAPMPEDDLNPATMGTRYPRMVTWTIAFDGRNLGTVKSAQIKYTNRSQLGLQQLTPESQVWLKTLPAGIRMKGSEARRLVVVSRPNYQDPDRWKPTTPDSDPAVLNLARGAFRKLAQTQAGEPCDCPEKLLRISSKPYRSARGDVLIGLVPEQGQCVCYPSEDWFLVRSGKAVNFRSIYDGGDSFQLIDGGDYTASGVSDVLFFEEGIGDGRDALVLLSTRDGAVTVFTVPTVESF